MSHKCIMIKIVSSDLFDSRIVASISNHLFPGQIPYLFSLIAFFFTHIHQYQRMSFNLKILCWGEAETEKSSLFRALVVIQVTILVFISVL
jgi:hypothetical protein